MPINAPAAGVIEELLVADGATVQPGMAVFKLRVGATGGAASSATSSATSSAPKKDSSQALPVQPPPASAPRSAPIGQIPTSGVKPATAAKPSSPAPVAPSVPGQRTEQRVKVTRMRARIAERLKDAQNTYAMLTTFNEIDMT